MSRMGMKLDEALDANKYKLYEALKNLVERIDEGVALGEKLDIEPARKVLNRVEKL